MNKREPSDSRASTSPMNESADELALNELMRRTQEGDKACYEKLIRGMYQLLSTFVRNSFFRLGMADTGGHEDIVHEILLGIHEKRGTYDPTQPFLPWMYAIARYKIIDNFRRHRKVRNSSVSLEDELDSLVAVESAEIGAGEDLLVLMSSLPEKQRQVLKLIKLDGLSVREAAAKTGYSASDIKVTVHRALQSLQNRVKKEGE